MSRVMGDSRDSCRKRGLLSFMSLVVSSASPRQPRPMGYKRTGHGLLHCSQSHSRRPTAISMPTCLTGLARSRPLHRVPFPNRSQHSQVTYLVGSHVVDPGDGVLHGEHVAWAT